MPSVILICKARKLMDISRSKPPSDASFAMSDEADQNGSALYVQPASVIAALEREWCETLWRTLPSRCIGWDRTGPSFGQ